MWIEPDEPDHTKEFAIEYPRSAVAFWGSNLPDYASRRQRAGEPEFGLYLTCSAADEGLYRIGQDKGLIGERSIQALSTQWTFHRPSARFWDTALPLGKIQREELTLGTAAESTHGTCFARASQIQLVDGTFIEVAQLPLGALVPTHVFGPGGWY